MNRGFWSGLLIGALLGLTAVMWMTRGRDRSSPMRMAGDAAERSGRWALRFWRKGRELADEVAEQVARP